MRKLLKIVLMVGIVFYAVSIWATPVLNQTTVVVADRSAAALQLALQSAFSEVMMKMSGNPNEMNEPIIQNAAKNVTNWVESYSYIQSPNTSAQGSSGLLLQVVFDQDGLQKLLNKASQKTAQTTQTVQPAPQLNVPSTVMVAVSGIHSLADYVQVMRALRDKNDVMHVSVKDMQSDHVLLKIKVIGNSAEFQKVLASDSNFKAPADGVQTKLLQYYWMGNQA